MSDPVTALRGASNTDGIAEVTALGPIGMITLRGDLADKVLATAAVAAGGVNLPDQRQINLEGAGGIAWMSPDEMLILCDYAEVRDRLSVLQGALKEQHALAVNVSDARAVFEVRSPQVRDVLAKLVPVNLDPEHFSAGDFRRTRLAQVAAAFWLVDDETARIVCFRSVAQYVFDVLNVASQPGSEVGFHAKALVP